MDLAACKNKAAIRNQLPMWFAVDTLKICFLISDLLKASTRYICNIFKTTIYSIWTLPILVHKLLHKYTSANICAVLCCILLEQYPHCDYILKRIYDPLKLWHQAPGDASCLIVMFLIFRLQTCYVMYSAFWHISHPKMVSYK